MALEPPPESSHHSIELAEAAIQQWAETRLRDGPEALENRQEETTFDSKGLGYL